MLERWKDIAYAKVIADRDLATTNEGPDASSSFFI